MAGLGTAGEIIQSALGILHVKIGQARNYLIPFGHAVYLPKVRGKVTLPAGFKSKEIIEEEIEITPAFMDIPYSEAKPQSHANLEQKLENSAQTYLQKLSQAQAHEQLTSIGTIIFRRVRINEESSRIFGSVGQADILKFLKDELSINADMTCIFNQETGGRIKLMGDHLVSVSFSEEGLADVEIKVQIVDA